MTQIIKSLRQEFPQLKFSAAEHFSWSPQTGEVFYVSGKNDIKSAWSILHETGHALLAHQSYKTDFELLKLEVAAWEKAQELAKKLQIKIDKDYIQDCLDTYRDWLHSRSKCPTCNHISPQQNDISLYRCFNCQATWKVTPSRFCRAYRLTTIQAEE